MKFSKWASKSKHIPGIDDRARDKKENLHMNNEQRDAAVRGLLNKARSNRGEATDEEKQREEAVNFLAGKTTPQKPLRPGVRELLGGGR